MLQKWNDPLVKNQRLLICSDDTLLDYYIDDADCLIHYDIPPEKHKFIIRFSVLHDSNTIFKVSLSNLIAFFRIYFICNF